jgi:hypothetical protein
MDVVSVKNPTLPPTRDNLKAVYEIKFPGDKESNPRMGMGQFQDCKDVAGDAHFEVLRVETCCKPEPEPEPEPEFEYTRELTWWQKLEVALLIVALIALIADDLVGIVMDDPAIAAIIARLASYGVKVSF